MASLIFQKVAFEYRIDTGVIVWCVPPLLCPPGHYSLVNIVPPDIIH